MLIRIDQCCFAGGTLAIYSLLCRHAKVKLIPNQHRSDEDLTTYSRTVSAEGSFAAKTKKWLEGKEWRKRALLVVVLLGTCMMIGDGILTPAISVLSATGGIKVNNPKMSGGNIHFTLFSTSGFESVLVLLTCYFSRLQISSCLWQLSF
jgi:KUP system potassium uptake protein